MHSAPTARFLSCLLQAGAVAGLLLLQHSVCAQAVRSDTPATVVLSTQVEQEPQLPKANHRYTNQEAVVWAIQRACCYPAEAFRNRVQGTVVVGFTVNQRGQVGEVRVEQGLTTDLDEATVAAVKALPLFRPGRQGGQAVTVRYSLPIRWALR